MKIGPKIYGWIGRTAEKHPGLAKAARYSGSVLGAAAGAVSDLFLSYWIPRETLPASITMGSLFGEGIARNLAGKARLAKLEGVFSNNVRELAITRKGKTETRQYLLTEDKIGEGGQADVRLAVNLSEGNRLEVMKIMHEPLPDDESRAQRFKREIDILEGLDDPNIIRVYGHGKIGERPFYLMEKNVSGNSLFGTLNQVGKIPPLEATMMMINIAEAFSRVHKNGIVHRDIKPENILLGRKNEIKIIDFGLVLDQEALTRLTKTGAFFGTLEYMAPEQFYGTKMDFRTDLYALGITFFQMLAGSTPYPQGNQSQLEYITERQKLWQRNTLPQAGRLFANVEPGKAEDAVALLQTIFDQTLAAKPDQRYESDDLFIRDLKNLANILGSIEPTVIRFIGGNENA